MAESKEDIEFRTSFNKAVRYLARRTGALSPWGKGVVSDALVIIGMGTGAEIPPKLASNLFLVEHQVRELNRTR